MSPEKALKRINKLIDLACSTGPQGERESAALEAAEMIRRHEVTLNIEKPDEPTEMPPATVQASTPKTLWLAADAPKDGRCTQCQGEIKKGDRIWYRPGAAVHEWPCWLD